MFRTSSNYVMTIDTNSVDDFFKLEAVKETVKIINSTLKDSERSKRVVLRGRKPRSKINGKSYDWGGNIVGGIANATMIDVYVYNR